MQSKEVRPARWRRLALLGASVMLSIYCVMTLQGAHGIGALRGKLAEIQALHAQNADLKRMIEEKKRRVQSLEKGQDLEMELRRFGRTLPGEVEYKVTEPKVEDPGEESPTAP